MTSRTRTRVSPFTIAALLTAQVGQALTFVMLGAILPQIAAYFGGGREGEMIAQQMAVFPFLGLTVGGFVSGIVISRAGLRPTALASALVYALAGAVPLVATTATPMLAASFALGLAASLLTSAISGISAQVYQGEKLAKFVSYQVALAIFSGASLGFVAALAAGSWGWRAAFAGYVVTGLAILAIGLAGLPDGEAGGAQNEGGSALAVIRLSWPVYLLGFLSFIMITFAPTYLPFFMEERGVTDPAMRALLLTVSTGTSFLGSVGYSQVQGRIAQRTILTVAVALLAVAYLLYATWNGGIPAMAAAMAMAGLGGGMIIPALFAAALSSAPQAGGQSVGFLNVAIFSGSFLTPYLLAVPREALGMVGLLWAFLVAILIIGAVTLRRVSGEIAS